MKGHRFPQLPTDATVEDVARYTKDVARWKIDDEALVIPEVERAKLLMMHHMTIALIRLAKPSTFSDEYAHVLRDSCPVVDRCLELMSLGKGFYE